MCRSDDKILWYIRATNAVRRLSGWYIQLRLTALLQATHAYVSDNTDYLLAGANVGASKTAKADKLGVTVVDQDQLWAWLREAGVA